MAQRIRAKRLLGLFVVLPLVLAGEGVLAHSASDAYLSLTEPRISGGSALIHGQWDIALRDLDFVLGLDDDGDGRLTWGEIRRHQSAIEHYAYAHLRFDEGRGKPCAIHPQRQLIDNHADGAYAALFFDVVCPSAARQLTLDYRIFFQVDPSHRGIFVMHGASGEATAVLSPGNARIQLSLK